MRSMKNAAGLLLCAPGARRRVRRLAGTLCFLCAAALVAALAPPAWAQGEWSFREYDSYGEEEFVDIEFARSEASQVEMYSTTGSHGTGYFFRSFPKADLRGKTLKFSWIAFSDGGGVTIDFAVVDGAYTTETIAGAEGGWNQLLEIQPRVSSTLEEGGYRVYLDPQYIDAAGDATIVCWMHDAGWAHDGCVRFNYIAVEGLFHEEFNGAVTMTTGGTQNDEGTIAQGTDPGFTLDPCVREYDSFGRREQVEVVAAKPDGSTLRVTSTDGSHGKAYFFKVIEVTAQDKAEGIPLRWSHVFYSESSSARVGDMVLLDGAYNAESVVGCEGSGLELQLLHAGIVNGLQARGNEVLLDVSQASADHVTVVAYLEDWGWATTARMTFDYIEAKGMTETLEGNLTVQNGGTQHEDGRLASSPIGAVDTGTWYLREVDSWGAKETAEVELAKSEPSQAELASDDQSYAKGYAFRVFPKSALADSTIEYSWIACSSGDKVRINAAVVEGAFNRESIANAETIWGTPLVELHAEVSDTGWASPPLRGGHAVSVGAIGTEGYATVVFWIQDDYWAQYGFLRLNYVAAGGTHEDFGEALLDIPTTGGQNEAKGVTPKEDPIVYDTDHWYLREYDNCGTQKGCSVDLAKSEPSQLEVLSTDGGYGKGYAFKVFPKSVLENTKVRFSWIAQSDSTVVTLRAAVLDGGRTQESIVDAEEAAAEKGTIVYLHEEIGNTGWAGDPHGDGHKVEIGGIPGESDLATVVFWVSDNNWCDSGYFRVNYVTAGGQHEDFDGELSDVDSGAQYDAKKVEAGAPAPVVICAWSYREYDRRARHDAPGGGFTKPGGSSVKTALTGGEGKAYFFKVFQKGEVDQQEVSWTWTTHDQGAGFDIEGFFVLDGAHTYDSIVDAEESGEIVDTLHGSAGDGTQTSSHAVTCDASGATGDDVTLVVVINDEDWTKDGYVTFEVISVGTAYSEDFEAGISEEIAGTQWDEGRTFCEEVVPPTLFAGTVLGTTSIEWTWVDNSTNETGFVIQNRDQGVEGSVGANVTVFVEEDLTENEPCDRHVHAALGGLLSGPSNSELLHSLIHAPALDDFQAAALSHDRILIAVVPPAHANSHDTGVEVQRGDSAQGWITIRDFSNVYSYQDAGLEANTTYAYRIRYRNGDGTPTNYSPALQVPTPPPSPTITTPEKKTKDNTPLVEGTGNAGNLIKVFFNGQYDGEATCRADGNWTYHNLAAVKGDATYAVTAVESGSGGDSLPSDPVSITVDTTPPDAPSAVNATGHPAGIVLEWTASAASDTLGYNIYRKASDETSFQPINPKVVLGTKYLDVTAEVGKLYTYKLTAVDDALNEAH